VCHWREETLSGYQSNPRTQVGCETKKKKKNTPPQPSERWSLCQVGPPTTPQAPSYFLFHFSDPPKSRFRFVKTKFQKREVVAREQTVDRSYVIGNQKKKDKRDV
jgi:hypothetical protein